MTLDEFDMYIVEKEGKLESVSIAQVKEIMRIILQVENLQRALADHAGLRPVNPMAALVSAAAG